ncbi:MAG: bifunctional oligoribonuclease/PAP phosphatase NrnA [Flavobacteriales bacterium]|nr:bifunctional oligoribonuclease/PAP phosphatase NrnA [Flavobacteriales bacterium]
MLLDTFIDDLIESIENTSKILILTHYNPDGDAIGSSLALQKYLELKGKEPEIIVPNDFPKFLKFLPKAKKITIAEYRKKFVPISIKEADLIFCLDFNSPKRIQQLEQNLIESKAKKILIDHHQEPEQFDLMYSDTSAPATCQMVYEVIEKLGDKDLITEEIATCIYAGIYTDTGGFRFRSTSARTHRITADLMEKGIKNDEIISNILDNNTLSRFMLLAEMLRKMEVLEEKKTAILYLTRDDMLKYGYQKGDTEGFVNYGLSILGVQFSVFLVDDLKNDFVKLSFRSNTDFDVSTFAKKHFNGGGHKQASGGKSEESVEDTIKKIKTILEEYEI